MVVRSQLRLTFFFVAGIYSKVDGDFANSRFRSYSRSWIRRHRKSGAELSTRAVNSSGVFRAEKAPSPSPVVVLLSRAEPYTPYVQEAARLSFSVQRTIGARFTPVTSLLLQ